MVLHIQQMLRSLRIFLVAFWPCGQAVVVCPATMAAGETYFCYVNTGSSEVPQIVLAAQSGASLATALPDQHNQGLYALTVPSTIAAGTYLVQESGGPSSQVTIAEAAGLVLLEADKALYKPGQIARFRALATSAALRPVARNLTFEVTSPEGFKLLEVASETDAAGVAHFSFPIAQEPLLGAHAARATLTSPTGGAGATAEAAFGVEEYVLPRFEVHVDVDQSHLTYGRNSGGDVALTGKVSANFTFGEPVPGVASVTLWSPLSSWEVSQSRGAASPSVAGEPNGVGLDHRALASLSGLQLSTSAPTQFELTIPASELRGGTLRVEATVVHAATGERQSSTTPLMVLYEGSELQAEITLADGSEVFRPGLPTSVNVRLAKPDGTAPTAEDLSGFSLRLAVEAQTVSYSHRPDTVYFDLVASGFQNGMQAIEVPAVIENAACCNPMASRTTYKEHEEACGCCVHGLRFYAERKDPADEYWQRIYAGIDGKSAGGCASRAWSPDGSFLALGTPTESNGGWTMRLRSNRGPSGVDSSIEYFVTQAGTFVAGGTAAVELTSQGDFYEGTIQMSLPTSLSGELRFVAVARTTPEGRAVAGSATISRSLQLPFTLAASFSAQEVKPGASLTIQVQAGSLQSGNGPSAAHAFVTSLDRSAELLGLRTAIGQAGLLAALGRAADGNAATPVAGRAWRHCSVYGPDLMVVAELPEQVQVVADSSLQPVTDDAAYGEPLGDFCPRPLYDGSFCAGGGDMMVDDMAVMAMAGGVPEMAMDDGMDAVGREAEPPAEKSSGGEGSTALRTFFPETWIWTDFPLITGGDGASATLPVTAPDTITTWSLEAFATSPDGISAVRAEVPLRVFKPFFCGDADALFGSTRRRRGAHFGRLQLPRREQFPRCTAGGHSA